MAKKETMWIIGAVVVGGVLYFLLKKPEVAIRAPAVGVPGVPIAPSVAPVREVGVRGQLISMAMQQTGLSEESLTIRSLLPSDIGLTTWSMNLSVANAWNTAVNTTVASDRFVAITGVSYAGSAAESVRVTGGGSRLAEFSIERVPGITTTHHIDINPVIIQQNQNITIDVYASTISATDNVILEGITVEPRGRLLA